MTEPLIWTGIPDRLVLLLEYGLLIVALIITLASSVKRVIFSYQVQSGLLALAVFITAWKKLAGSTPDHWELAIMLILILILPLGLMISVGWLLRRATAWAGKDQGNRRRPALPGRTEEQSGGNLESPKDKAERLWRDVTAHAVSHRISDVVVFVAIIILAALTAKLFHLPTPDETVGLTVSLTLHLIGLYMIAAKLDLISQTVGLLVMDHGLYLAIVKIVALPAPGLFFVFGLWCYTAITLFILWHMVPQIRLNAPRGIDLGAIAEHSDLKG